MRINFFEEFPTKDNLEKLNLINFNSTIYFAAKSLKEFNSIKNEASKINKKIEVAYWPILKKSYWISPFSNTKELQKLQEDLRKIKEPTKILIDLELPILNPILFFKNFISFRKNKKLIIEILKEPNIEILTAEYATSNKVIKKIIELLGVSYSTKKYNHTKIIMFYSSMIKNKFILNKIKNNIKKQNKNIQVGLGTIATGILQTEPTLTPENLEKDLSFCKNQNIETATIFRLGGINNDYIKIIKTFL